MAQFKKKVDLARSIIEEANSIAPAYVACSWGKDSTTLLHIAQSVKKDIKAIFWTDPEQEMLGNYSDVIAQYCQRFSPNYMEIDVTGDRVPEKVRLSQIWLEYPVSLVGIRKEEGGKRKHAAKYGAIHQYKTGPSAGTWRCWPLITWTWRDVWAYILSHDLPYLSAYDHPGAQHKSRSRTCNLFAKKSGNTKGLGAGRIADLRRINPEYYEYLAEFYPSIASNH